jgi:hypothetical protein
MAFSDSSELSEPQGFSSSSTPSYSDLEVTTDDQLSSEDLTQTEDEKVAPKKLRSARQSKSKKVMYKLQEDDEKMDVDIDDEEEEEDEDASSKSDYVEASFSKQGYDTQPKMRITLRPPKTPPELKSRASKGSSLKASKSLAQSYSLQSDSTERRAKGIYIVNPQLVS